MVVLATQTPPILVLKGPQPKATWVIKPSGWWIGAGGMACEDAVRAKANTATAIDLIICFSPMLQGALLEAAPDDNRWQIVQKSTSSHDQGASFRRAVKTCPCPRQRNLDHEPQRLMGYPNAGPYWSAAMKSN
jgi:hypothetical protein